MKPVKIPRRIDEPPHLLMWSVDELAPIMIGLLVGVLIDKQLIMIVLGFLVTNVYRKFRDNHADGYLIHMMYWSGILPTKSKLFINPYIRKLYP